MKNATFTKIYIMKYALLLISIILFSCHKKDEPKPKPTYSIIGTWASDSDPTEHFFITKDSFSAPYWPVGGKMVYSYELKQDSIYIPAIDNTLVPYLYGSGDSLRLLNIYSMTYWYYFRVIDSSSLFL